MLNLSLTKSGPIGCHVDHCSLHLVQLQWRGSKRPIAVSARAALAADATLETTQNAVKSAVQSASFHGSDVVACLPRHVVCYRYLRLPPMPTSEVNMALRFRLAKEMQWQVKEFTASFHSISRSGARNSSPRDLLAVAVRHDALAPTTHLLRSADLTPVALDDETAAIARCLAHSEEVPYFLVAIGDTHTIVATVQDGRPYFARVMHAGRASVIAHAAKILAPLDVTEEALWHLLDSQSDALLHEHNNGKTLDALQSAFALLGKALAHEIVLCQHYLADTLHLEAEPQHGVIIGAGSFERALQSQLAETAHLTFVNTTDALRPSIREHCDAIAPLALIGPWLTAIGLACYSIDSTTQEDAA